MFLDYPVFILKKELLKIPLFGLYLKKIKSIEIVRDTTTKDNLNFFDKVANIIKNEKKTSFNISSRNKSKS